MNKFLCLWALLVSVLAFEDVISLENGKMIKTCSYVSASDTWPESIFGSTIPAVSVGPSIEDMDFNHLTGEMTFKHGKFDIYTLIMGAKDLAKVNIGIDPYYEFCDDVALDAGYCKPETDEQKASKVSLTELIESNDFSYPIESFMLDSTSRHRYDIKKSGIYCVIFHTNSIPKIDDQEEEPSWLLHLLWMPSYGGLTLSDFHLMLLSLALTICYGLYSLIYLGLSYRHIYSDKTSRFSIDSLKNMRFMFQYKIISFLVGMFMVQLFTLLYFIHLNRYGYFSPILILFILMTLHVASDLSLTSWVVYNLILFSAGVWVGPLKKSSKKVKAARVVTILYIFQMTLLGIIGRFGHSLVDDEKFSNLTTITDVQLLTFMTLCFFWSFHTIYNIENKQIRKLYIQTVFMLGFVFCGPLILMIFEYTPQLYYIASFIHFVATVVISLLWKDVVFQNGLLCF